MQNDMIIDGMTGERLQGAGSQFMFKGYLISNSQVFKGNDIAIFKDDDMVGGRFGTVEAAIDYVIGLSRDKKLYNSLAHLNNYSNYHVK